MFGAFGAAAMMHRYQQAKAAPSKTVTAKQFLAACKADGMDDAKAKQTLKMCRALGSSVLIGGVKLEPKKSRTK